MTKRRDPGTTADVIDRALDQAGGRKAAGATLGLSAQRLHEATDPDPNPQRYGYRFTYEDARALTATGKVTAFAEDMAHVAGGMFLPPLDPASGEIARLAALLGKESGEAGAKLFTALLDGVLTPTEAREALPEVADVCRAVSTLYSRLLAHAASHDNIETFGGLPKGRARA